MRLNQKIGTFENFIYRRYRTIHGLRIGIAFVCSFWLIRITDIPEGTWPLITLVVLLGPMSFWGNVTQRTLHRIGGTIIGSVSGFIALYLELYSFPFMLIWCGIVMFFCGYLALGKRPYMALLIGITISVVVGAPAGDMHTALWRSGDVILGALMALLFASIYPQRAFIHWRLQMSDALSDLAKIYGAYTSLNLIERPNLSNRLQKELNRIVKMRTFVKSASRETQMTHAHFNDIQTICRDLICTFKFLIESHWSSRDAHFWMINAKALRNTSQLIQDNLYYLSALLIEGIDKANYQVASLTDEIIKELDQFNPDINYQPDTESSIYGYIWLTRKMGNQLKELERLINDVIMSEAAK